MNGLWSEKDKESILEFFNLSAKGFFQKRVAIAILFCLFPLFLLFVSSKWEVLIALPIVFLLGYKIPYLKLLSRKIEIDSHKGYAFPKFIRYFLIKVESHGNIYHTFKAIVPYVDEPIRSELKKLIHAMEINENRYEAFVEFSRFLGTPEAIMCMDMIYQFDQKGIRKENLIEIENMIKDLQENKTQLLIKRSVRKMEVYANPSIILSMLFMFVLVGSLYVHYGSEALSNIN